MSNIINLIDSSFIRDMVLSIVIIYVFTKNNKLSEKQNGKLNEMLNKIDVLINNLVHIIGEFSVNKFQAQIIKSYFFEVEKLRFIKGMFQIYQENYLHKREDIEKKINSIIMLIIRKVDEDLKKINGMENYLIPTDMKLEYIVKKQVACKIYDVLLEIKKSEYIEEKKNDLLRIRLSNLYDTYFNDILEEYKNFLKGSIYDTNIS